MAWWLEEINIGGSQGPTYQVVQSSTKPNPKLVITGEHTNVNVTGPFASRAIAQAKIPSGAHTGPYTPQFAGQAKPQAPSVPSLTGVAAIGDFFSRLGNANTWIRAVKVIAGGALIIIGVSHMTGANNKIARTARKVPVVI